MEYVTVILFRHIIHAQGRFQQEFSGCGLSKNNTTKCQSLSLCLVSSFAQHLPDRLHVYTHICYIKNVDSCIQGSILWACMGRFPLESPFPSSKIYTSTCYFKRQGYIPTQIEHHKNKKQSIHAHRGFDFCAAITLKCWSTTLPSKSIMKPR